MAKRWLPANRVAPSWVATPFPRKAATRGSIDDFVVPAHTELLQREYAGEAQRLLIPSATHNSRRSLAIRGRAAVFMVRALRWEPYLTPGVTEEILAQIAAGVVGPMQQRLFAEKQEAIEAELDYKSVEISRLIKSADARERSLGLVRAACELCGAYRGAEFLPCNSSKEFSGETQRADYASVVSSARLPVRFTGNVVFGSGGSAAPTTRGSRGNRKDEGRDDVMSSRRAELALCWVRSGSNCTNNSVAIGFAVLSEMAVSLTTVILVAADMAVERQSESMTNRQAIAGLICEELRPHAVLSTGLAADTPHNISLYLTEDGGAEFMAGGVRAHCLAGSCPRSEDTGGVHVWCMQWRGDSSVGEPSTVTCLEFGVDAPAPEQAKSARFEYATDLRHASGSDAGASPRCTSSLPLEERLTRDLATLCFGTPPSRGMSLDAEWSLPLAYTVESQESEGDTLVPPVDTEHGAPVGYMPMTQSGDPITA
eukprot:TRINITY_DN12581_c0_g1_i1.p1 TRINITY_DN12581_c0_g1~~TRINITY_DN12581_c0_g1_i1.p1  ORF type:complete len:484 (+),score=67.87 TRINITY_DN12581_c0_g1_i1:880-2331(+)